MSFKSLWLLFFIVLVAAVPRAGEGETARKWKCWRYFDITGVNKEVYEPARVFIRVVSAVSADSGDDSQDQRGGGGLWKLAWAIGRHESANFTACPGGCKNSHNYWGRKAKSGGWMCWESDEEAWADQIDYLQRRYYGRGLTTLEEIGSVYAGDPGWAAKVRQFLSGEG